MANIILTGIIRKINSSEVKGTFEKRTLHLGEEKEKYASVWLLEAHQAMCNTLDGYRVGDKVECNVDVVGREWNEKAFNTLKLWKINKVGEQQHYQRPSAQSHATAPYNMVEDSDDDGSLPF